MCGRVSVRLSICMPHDTAPVPWAPSPPSRYQEISPPRPLPCTPGIMSPPFMRARGSKPCPLSTSPGQGLGPDTTRP